MESHGDSGDEECEGWDDEEYEDPVLENTPSENTLAKIKDYRIYTSEEIMEKQGKIIQNVREILGVDEDDAITALKNFSWSAEQLEEKWFSDEDKTKYQ